MASPSGMDLWFVTFPEICASPSVLPFIMIQSLRTGTGVRLFGLLPQSCHGFGCYSQNTMNIRCA